MASIPAFVADMLDRADASLVAGWYHAVSVSTERFRAWLRFRGLAFVDPAATHPPSMGELDRTAEVVIARARSGAGAVSGAAGLAGAASVPPEVLASMISTIRLGQRLCVVYGYDPWDDRGQMALVRALAVAYDVELPATGSVGIRVSDLAGIARPRTDPRGIGANLARAVAVRSAWWVAGRVTRFVPVLSAGASAVDARRRTEQVGRRMQGVLRRLAEVPDGSPLLIEEAQEVR